MGGGRKRISSLASPPEIIGTLPDGIRLNFYSTGGAKRF
jgi:hypothetical protein